MLVCGHWMATCQEPANPGTSGTSPTPNRKALEAYQTVLQYAPNNKVCEALLVAWGCVSSTVQAAAARPGAHDGSNLSGLWGAALLFS